MGKKTKKRLSAESKASDSSFKQKLRAYFLPIQLYVNQLPVVIEFKKKKARISEKLRLAILAFFAYLAPCWNFFFLGTPKPNTDDS